MAGVKIVEIPAMNPYRFIEENHPYEGYMTLNSDWYVNQQAAWNVTPEYYQKVELDGYLGVQAFIGGAYVPQIFSPDSDLFILDIISCHGNTIGTIRPTSLKPLPGNILNMDGVPYQMFTINFKGSFRSYTSEEGTYYLRLRIGTYEAGDLVYTSFLSEPIDVREKHPGTMLIEYISYSNKLNVDYTNMFFHIRVEGEMILDQPKVNSINYQDQGMNPRQQMATPYNSFLLKMGAPHGVPMWILDKVNRALSNDLVLIEKVQYVREDGAEIEITKRPTNYQRYSAQVRLQEKNQIQATLTVGASPIELFKISDAPLVLYRGVLTNSFGTNNITYWEGYEVRNASDAQDFVQAANTYRGGGKLRGRFEIRNGYVVYINGEKENFNASQNVILTKSFTLWYTKAGTAIQPSIMMNTSIASIVFRHHHEVFNLGTPDGNTYNTAGRAYDFGPNVNEAQVRIYHNDSITSLISRPSLGSVAPLTAIDAGFIPTNLQELYIWGAFGPTLDFTPFPDTMTRISVRDSSLFLNSIVGFNKNWLNLSYIDFRDNFFSSATVDSIFNQHYNGGGYTPPTGGTIIVSGANMGAPTNASLTARNNLVANSWIIIT